MTTDQLIPVILFSVTIFAIVIDHTWGSHKRKPFTTLRQEWSMALHDRYFYVMLLCILGIVIVMVLG